MTEAATRVGEMREYAGRNPPEERPLDDRPALARKADAIRMHLQRASDLRTCLQNAAHRLRGSDVNVPGVPARPAPPVNIVVSTLYDRLTEIELELSEHVGQLTAIVEHLDRTI